MHDDEIEVALRRYQACGPPASLRTAVVSRRVRLRGMDWTLIAAAAVLVIAAIVTGGGDGRHRPSSVDSEWLAQVEAAAAELGRGREAVALARMTLQPPAVPPPGIQEEP